MAKLTVVSPTSQERGRQWAVNFHVVGAPVRRRFLSWKAPELKGEDADLEVEDFVDEFTTRGEYEARRIIHRNNLRAAEYY